LQVKNKRKTTGVPKESAQKYSNIAEIISLLEERKKSKEWIFQQVKRHRLKINCKRSMNSFQVLKSCPDDFVSHILDELKGDDLDDFHDVISLSKTYHWFFTDVVAGANPSIETTEQLRKIATLHKLVANSDIFSAMLEYFWALSLGNSVVFRLCLTCNYRDLVQLSIQG